jgi:hypothetical protein
VSVYISRNICVNELEEMKDVFYVVTVVKVSLGSKHKGANGVCTFPNLLICANIDKLRVFHICNGEQDPGHIFNSLFA